MTLDRPCDVAFCEVCGYEFEEGDDRMRGLDGEIICELCAEEEHHDPFDEHDDESLIDGVGFADPGGRSSLRAATESNPRNLPCPTCKAENVLTPLDRANGYQCDACADAAEGVGP
jgi:hypothetical protein